MICKFVKCVYVNKLCHYKTSVRSSSLFINGLKATDTFVYLTPHIDFPERIANRKKLETVLSRRKANNDLSKLENLWTFYKDLEKKKNDLDKKREELSKEISALIGTGDVIGLKLKISLIKENIKKLKPPLWSAEEVAIVETLKLPNILHPMTPDGENKIIFTNYAAPQSIKNHLDVGRDLKLLHFTKNENYYLKNDAAVFELGAKFYFSKALKKANFISFSNPDFVKSLIVEGCGEDHTNPDSTFILHHNEDSNMNIDSRLHLTGAGSLFSFLAYHAKNVVHGKTLPLKYFAMGRHYKPSSGEEDSLFHVSQSSVIQIFEVAKSEENLDTLLHELIEVVKDCYDQLGYHFRLCVIPANELCMWESLRVSIQMYSSSLKKYVEIGNISVSGDFISKRLMFTYTDDKKSKFPHIISGTILNVPKFLGCVLEQDDEFIVPKAFEVENWKM